jgi:hypothetical protein
MLHFGNRSLRINCRIFAIGASGQQSHRIAQETGAEGHSGEMCKGTHHSLAGSGENLRAADALQLSVGPRLVRRRAVFHRSEPVLTQ